MSLRRSAPVTAESAGWTYCGLDVVKLLPGQPRRLETGGAEFFVLPLAGSLRVTVAGPNGESAETFDLAGRTSVFTSVTDFLYVGRDSSATMTSLSSTGAEVALPSARCDTRRPARYGPADGVRVEVRGAGAASRQVINFGTPGVWDHAEKLICCELLTPPGNWSSYPPHKHDATAGCSVVNEEIYYYRVAGVDQVTPDRQGFGFHRTYTGDEHSSAGLTSLDETLVVRDGDVVLVPHGYHGPCIAAPGYPMYYLNVMAGPGAERSMAFCDDSAHAWIRDSWGTQTIDPRIAGVGGDV
ncbi:5-deoxyglucuronate isomerase [Jatrophihabitans sp. GAS493]|uniref:5-deoxy-glucuronate isomerase n=1 Tax=Jatrophihabitans sp. GAS493 TaxID=1907575 RepID=UPI000BB7D33D|nr:5-deoxy-glucuronate isomerase [Jatrophihabitans sp. GAS493]SOD73718.1 5-deoxyglucuronate isomerase [Jatrophihabitans sp. GAS493]